MDNFNLDVLDVVLKARQLSFQDLSNRLAISEPDLRGYLRNDPKPNQSLISDLGKQLSVPTFVFYMEHAPHLEGVIPDFRQPTPTSTPKRPETIASIDLARRLQEIATALGHTDELPSGVEPTVVRSVDFATKTRASLGITDEIQLSAKNSSEFYKIFRAAIEKKGLFVIHESFPQEDGSGFCLSYSGLNFIVINTKNQNYSRRLFTLCHELAHAYIGRTGISDPFVTSNSIEKSCNLFAARVLLPKSLVSATFKRFNLSSQPSLSQIARCAKYLNVSQEATVVRFEQLDFIGTGSHRRWLEEVKLLGNPDFASGGGGGNIPQERIKLAKFGFTFAKVFGRALDDAEISPLSLYRASGLKPKYQKPYFNFASGAGATDAED